MQLRVVAVALALLGAVAAGPTPAETTPVGLGPFDRIPAAGTGPDGMEFVGTLDVRDFEAREDRLVALGTLSGQITRTVGGIAEPIATLDETPAEVPVGVVAATCERLAVTFGPLPLDLHGPEVQVSPIRVEGADGTADGNAIQEQLCSIAARLRPETSPHRLAALLDSVNRSFD